MQERIIEIIAEQIGKPTQEILPEHSLLKDLQLDSIDMAEILGNIEDECPSLAFTNAEIKGLKTVADVSALVAAKIK